MCFSSSRDREVDDHDVLPRVRLAFLKHDHYERKSHFMRPPPDRRRKNLSRSTGAESESLTLGTVWDSSMGVSMTPTETRNEKWVKSGVEEAKKTDEGNEKDSKN